MTSLIADASVLVKVVVDEEWSAVARERLRSAEQIVCPDLAFAEAYMAVWKKWRRGELPAEHVERTPSALRRLVTKSVPLAVLFESAAALSRSLDHPIYDCFYLALAERERLPLVTADERMLAAAARVEGVEARRLGY